MSTRGQRGVTLIEVLVALAIAVLLSGGVYIGMGGLASARLRESSTLIAGAIRVAYNHANATSRPTRVVFDLSERTISIEDTEGRMLVQSGDRTGGAQAADEIEAEVQADSESIVEGTRAPRPEFRPVKKLLGFNPDKPGGLKSLGDGIYFRQIEVAHEDAPAKGEGRVYLYFWPGGQTERAAIQLQRGNLDDVSDSDVITIMVAPLTGKVEVRGGPIEMPRPQDDSQASEREDTG
jgi:general secretion pathway protein H